MSKGGQLKIEVVVKYESGKMTSETACKLLGISDRTLRRYVRDYKTRGLGFIWHKNKRKKPVNRHPDEVKQAVQKLMREVFFDFNMTHAAEKIQNNFGLTVPRETFRRWCHEIGMVKQKHRRRSKPRFRRERLAQSGILIQFDGSHHQWFDGEKKSCLLAAVDDATGEIIGAELCDGETTENCLRLLHRIVEKKGIFKALYVDRAGLYGGIKRYGFSQVARALEELGTHVIYAQSPEGKGRVERLFRTLQDRLIPELRVERITSLAKANEYLQNIYIPDHNNRFAIKPENPETYYKAVGSHQKLEDIFCVKEYRTVARDHTLSIFGQKWLVIDKLKHSIADQKIEIRIKQDQRMEVYFAGRLLSLMPIKKAA